jgi:hypothetical protein
VEPCRAIKLTHEEEAHNDENNDKNQNRGQKNWANEKLFINVLLAPT